MRAQAVRVHVVPVAAGKDGHLGLGVELFLAQDALRVVLVEVGVELSFL